MPRATISPASSTRIWSASTMLETRWATTIIVTSLTLARMAARSRASVAVSRAEYESSKMQDLGLAHQRPRDAQPLPLAARHRRAALGDLGLDPLGHLGDEVLCLGDLECLPELVVRGVGVAVAEVRRDGAAEEVGTLGHQPEALPQDVEVGVAHVHAVDEHLAARRVVQARDEVDERGLARAGAPDDRGARAALGRERDAGQDGLLRAGVGEGDVAELDRPRRVELGHGVGGRDDGGLGREHLLDAVGRDGGARNHDEQEGRHHHGHEDLDEVGEEREERADLHLAASGCATPRTRCTATLERLRTTMTTGNIVAMRRPAL